MTKRGSLSTQGGAFSAHFPTRGRARVEGCLATLRWIVPLVALSVLTPLATPLHGSAQEPTRIAALENERRLEYQAAADAYESALGARAAAEVRFARVTQELEDARTLGDDVRRNDALAQAQRLTSELLALDSRVAATNTSLEEAREGYLEILDIRLDFLAERIEFAGTAQDSTQLGAMYLDLSNRFAEVDSDERGAVTLVAMVIPEITATPRDGPRELRAKADLLERRAQQADSLIMYIDTELVDLERRARRDRGMQALQRGVERFDDARVPVQPPSPAEDDAQAQDATETPEQRVESLSQLREFYVRRRQEALRRANEFRALAGPTPGGTA